MWGRSVLNDNRKYFRFQAPAVEILPTFPLVFSLGLVLLGLGASVCTGIFSGFAPAWQASKLDPVVALRYE